MQLNTEFNNPFGCPFSLDDVYADPVSTAAEAVDCGYRHSEIYHLTLESTAPASRSTKPNSISFKQPSRRSLPGIEHSENVPSHSRSLFEHRRPESLVLTPAGRGPRHDWSSSRFSAFHSPPSSDPRKRPGWRLTRRAGGRPNTRYQAGRLPSWGRGPPLRVRPRSVA